MNEGIEKKGLASHREMKQDDSLKQRKFPKLIDSEINQSYFDIEVENDSQICRTTQRQNSRVDHNHDIMNSSERLGESFVAQKNANPIRIVSDVSFRNLLKASKNDESSFWQTAQEDDNSRQYQ